MSKEVRLEVSFPLDDDGFLRRECPHCRREFKLRVADDGGSDPPLSDPTNSEDASDELTDAFCPYRAHQSDQSELLTRGQRRVVEAAVLDQVVNPELGGLSDALAGIEAASGGLISASLERSHQPSADLTERNDMMRVDFTCHADDPVKVEDGWHGAVHCSICGKRR
jgi:hypothetical protein